MRPGSAVRAALVASLAALALAAAPAAQAAAVAIGAAEAGQLHAGQQGVRPARPSAGSVRWVSTYNGPANGFDQATASVVSPDGGTAFVTGSSPGAGTGQDVATRALDTGTGTPRWVARYQGAGVSDDVGEAIAVSPDGGTVFVSGSTGRGRAQDFLTVAYDAATGAQRWVAHYRGPAVVDTFRAMALSPNGTTVYVTGDSLAPNNVVQAATLAYDAATGHRIWLNRYNFEGDWTQPRALAVSPDGAALVVGATVDDREGRFAEAITYDAPTGALGWDRFSGGSAVQALAFDHTGNTVIAVDDDFSLVAFDVHSSNFTWLRNAPTRFAASESVAVSPDRSRLVVTGRSGSGSSTTDLVIAYDTATGGTVWSDLAAGIGVPGSFPAAGFGPDGSSVYVVQNTLNTQGGAEIATLVYDATTGLPRAIWTYAPAAGAEAASLALSPTGGRLFVSGTTAGDYLTVAYRTG